MPEQTRTCQWCNQPTTSTATVVKPYGTRHMDGPFRVCVARCVPLAEHFGYRVQARMEATR